MQALQGRTAAQSFHLGTANLLGARPWPQQRQGRLDSRRHKLGFESSRLRPVTTCSTATQEQAQVASEWTQKTFSLPSVRRGCHVMTRQITDNLPEVSNYEVGLVNFFVQHTSASLTINENCSPDVPLDLNDALDRIAPEGNHYRHLDEGYDDMPAHVKSSVMGASLTIPISQGRLALGTWQGIYLNEHRNHGGSRRVVATIQGRPRKDGRKFGKSW